MGRAYIGGRSSFLHRVRVLHGQLWDLGPVETVKKACIICGRPSVAGTSRCSKHFRGGRTGPSPYDAEHQRLAKQVLTTAEVCHICGEGPSEAKGPLQADHIVPLSMGGRTELSNYAAAHRKCNIAKGGANRQLGG